MRRVSDEQAALAAGVRRAWAWPEIAALAACVARLRGDAGRLSPSPMLAQIPAAALMSSRRASRRPAAEIRAASTPSSGFTGTTTSR